MQSGPSCNNFFSSAKCPSFSQPLQLAGCLYVHRHGRRDLGFLFLSVEWCLWPAGCPYDYNCLQRAPPQHPSHIIQVNDFIFLNQDFKWHSLLAVVILWCLLNRVFHLEVRKMILNNFIPYFSFENWAWTLITIAFRSVSALLWTTQCLHDR